MAVLLLSQCLIGAVVVYCLADNVAGRFTAAPPTCPSDAFTFSCTVVGNMSGITIWRVGGSTDCPLLHRSASSSSICNYSFTAKPGTGYGTNATSFTSTLSGTADPGLNSTLVECFGPANNVEPENRIDEGTLQILSVPPDPTLSCVDLFEDDSGSVNVTVSWTLSGRDSADFYLINITTNSSQTPYGGLLNITNASVTQYELTGFIIGQEYYITVQGVNCGSQEGGESEPLSITPQVPGVLRSCNITLTYNQSTERLQLINSTWDTMPDPLDSVEACKGPRGVITQYQTRFQSGSTVNTENVNIARCNAGRCSHTFEPPSNPPTSYDSVSVVAENVVGVGLVRICTAQPINTTNNILVAEVEGISSPNKATVNCTYLSGFTGSSRCTVQYGTDPTYVNLPYSAESIESGTAGDSVSVVLRQQLNSSTVYYYTVSAVSGDVTVIMQAAFIPPQYSCSLMELWNLSTTNSTSLHDVSLLDNAAHYQSCVTGSVGSVVLKDIRLNTSTVAYYTGITPGSKACFVCDENSGYELNTTTNERICQTDATWSEGPITCVPKTYTQQQQQTLMRWHITLIVIGVLAVVLSLVIIITVVVISCYKMERDDGSKSNAHKGLNLVIRLRLMLAVCMHSNDLKWWHIIVMVIAAILCLIGVVLWITVGAVVNSSPDDGWCNSCDALIILGFVFSLLPIILVPTVPTIYTPLRGQVLSCCKKWGVKSKPKHRFRPDRSNEMQLQEDELAVPGYDIIQHNQDRPRAVPNSSDPGYSLITEVPTGLRYAELGPHIPPAAVAPPAIDNNVRYTSLLHDQNQLEPKALTPAGSLSTSNDATSNSQSPLGSPPPIPPQQFSDEDILLLPKLSESMELQENCEDTPPPLPPKMNEGDIDLPPLPPKMNEEDMALPPLPPKINAEDIGLPPLPPKAMQGYTVLPSCLPKTNQEEGVILPLPSKVKQEDTTLPPLPPKRERKDTALYSCPPKANQEDAPLPARPPKVVQENTAPPPLPPKRHQQDTSLQPRHLKVNHEET